MELTASNSAGRTEASRPRSTPKFASGRTRPPSCLLAKPNRNHPRTPRKQFEPPFRGSEPSPGRSATSLQRGSGSPNGKSSARGARGPLGWFCVVIVETNVLRRLLSLKPGPSEASGFRACSRSGSRLHRGPSRIIYPVFCNVTGALLGREGSAKLRCRILWLSRRLPWKHGPLVHLVRRRLVLSNRTQ